jgi:D-alanine-D-alanine ligase-like ATP-grasp enzyme/acylphosphatase
MADPEVTTLTLVRVRATSYGRAGSEHLLVQLRGQTADGRQVDGMGEARSRAGASWEFLTECLRRLERRELPLTGPRSGAVRAIMAELGELASEYATTVAAEAGAEPAWRPSRVRRRTLLKRMVRRQARRAKRLSKRVLRELAAVATGRWRPSGPFQGVLRGIEAALHDLVAQVDGQPPATEYDVAAERFLRRTTDYVAFPSPPAPTHHGRTATVYDEVPYLKPLGSNGTKGHLLEREALRLGLTTTRFSKGAFLATDGAHPPLLFKWSRSPGSSAVSLALCTHKEATRLRLRRAGVPVPKGRTFTGGDFESATAFAERIGYPVVVKPAMGVRGIGVVANIQDRADLRRAFDQLRSSRLGGGDFIVEQHITGRDYRIVVVGEDVIAAILREPASVEGDGEHTVAELIVNKNVARHLNPHLWGRPIQYDDAASFQLERAGMTLGSVPEPGQRVLLSSSCSLSQGGDSIDVLEELHPSIKEACVQAVKAVPGLWFCGVDFLIEDHTRPLAAQSAGICELNAHAAIGNCEYPLYGAPRQVARTVMQRCVDELGLAAPDKPADRLAIRLTIRGQVTRVGYRMWMLRHARSFGLTGWVRNLDGGAVETVLVGDAAPASALAAAAVLGPRRAKPTSVTTEHIPPPAVDSFEILESAPGESDDARLAVS